MGRGIDGAGNLPRVFFDVKCGELEIFVVLQIQFGTRICPSWSGG